MCVLSDGSQRPVVVVGPLWECVAGKLVTDWPHVFARARPDPRNIRDRADKVRPAPHHLPILMFLFHQLKLYFLYRAFTAF